MDSHKNFAWAAVLTPPSPAASGTSLVLAAGAGALMPTPPFNATICPADTVPTTTNAEIVRVLALSGDTVTSMSRAQEGTLARTIVAGDIFADVNTNQAMMDAEGVILLQNVDTSAVSAGCPVYAGTSANTFLRTQMFSDPQLVVGLILDGSVAVSAVGRVQTAGRMALTTAQWDSVIIGGSGGGLVPGAKYGLSTTLGKIRTIVTGVNDGQPHLVVGVALSPTEMLLQISDVTDLSDALSTLTSVYDASFGLLFQSVADIAAAAAAAETHADTASAAATSVDARVNTLGQQVSVLSQAVSVLSQSQSVLSQAVSILSQGLSVEIGARIAKDDLLSNQISVVSSQVSTVSVAVTSVDTRLNTVSNQVSVLSQAVSILSQQVSVLSQAHSVLSQAHSVLSQTVSALNQQVSSEISNRVSADNQLSANIQTVSNAASNALSVASQALSLISVVSARTTAATSVKGLQSAINALSGRISAIAGGAGSVTSTEVSAVSAQAASAINVVSNAVSIVSTAASNALSVANAASNAASIVSSRVASILSVDLSVHSQAISVLSQQVSALSSQVSVVSVAVTSVDTRVNTVSQQVSALSQAVSVLSQAWSVLSAVSARTTAATSVKGMQSIINALSGRISAAVGGGGFAASALTTGGTSVQGAQSVVNALSSRISVVSNAISILSVNAASANNAVSAQAASALSDSVSVGTATANALSNAISALSLVVSPRRVVLTTVATVSASAMTNIAGMSISVNAGETCQFKAFLFVNRGAAGTIMGYGFTFPKMTRIRGRIIVPISVQQGALGSVADVPLIKTFNGDSASGSVLASVPAQTLVSVFVDIEAIMVVSTGGVVQMQLKAAGGASAATVLAGSYMQVLKIG